MTSKGMEKAPAKRRNTAPKNSVAPPSYQEIAKLAERYWIDRGRPDGTPEQDWLRAEKELRERAQAS